MAKREEILQVLNDLLRLDDILACMVAKKGLEGVVPDKNKIQNIDIFLLLKKTTDELFDVIDKFFDYGLGRIYLELGQYNVIIAPVDRSLGLIVIIPSLANMGLLDVEIENAKRKILGIMTKQGD